MEIQNISSSARALKDQYKKAKEKNGKSGEEPKSSPFYDQFD